MCFNFFHSYSKYRALLYNWLSVPSYPSNCAGETEKHCYNFLFLLFRRSFKGTNRLFCLSFYACKCGRTIFTQRLINLPCTLMSLWLFRIPRALKALMNGLYLPPQVGSLNILKDSQGVLWTYCNHKVEKSLSSERHSNRPSTSVIMPSSAEKYRERVKRWKKENPEKYK